MNMCEHMHKYSSLLDKFLTNKMVYKVIFQLVIPWDKNQTAQ